MAFIQRIHPAGGCEQDAHGDCHVIDCVTTEPVLNADGSEIHPAGAVVWRSHMDAAIHPEHRLNKDHRSEDRRQGTPVVIQWTPLCGDCKNHPAAEGHFGDA